MSKQEAVSPFATERARLEGQLQSLEEKRRAIAAALESIAEAERRVAAVTGQELGASHRGDAAGLRGERPQKRSLVIADVLRDAGRPLTVPEIGRELQRRGDPNDMGALRDIIHATCRRRPDLFEKAKEDDRVVWRLLDKAPAETAEGAGADSCRDNSDRNGHAGQRPHSGHHNGGDLAGMTVAEAALVVLESRAGEPMHYTALAEEMQRRGYKSPRSTPLRPTSVATILNGKPDQFKKMGSGRFTLAGK